MYMNVKSAVLRVIYHSDQHKLETEDRLHAIMYLIRNNTELDFKYEQKEKTGASIQLHSSEVQESLEDLRSHRLVEKKINQTIGGDEVVDYQLTEKGVEQMERLLKNNQTERKISEITNEYEDYPLSNLLVELYESEEAHRW